MRKTCIICGRNFWAPVVEHAGRDYTRCKLCQHQEEVLTRIYQRLYALVENFAPASPSLDELLDAVADRLIPERLITEA